MTTAYLEHDNNLGVFNVERQLKYWSEVSGCTLVGGSLNTIKCVLYIIYYYFTKYLYCIRLITCIYVI